MREANARVAREAIDRLEANHKNLLEGQKIAIGRIIHMLTRDGVIDCDALVERCERRLELMRA
jgi:hypothetical protein